LTKSSDAANGESIVVAVEDGEVGCAEHRAANRVRLMGGHDAMSGCSSTAPFAGIGQDHEWSDACGLKQARHRLRC
jgi:hypothetical protein